ncbi:MAG: hypothetical protein QXW00_00330 [Candidatus Woesearchaeota archaeon]
MRAQSSEFVGIIVLVATIVLIAIFVRMQTSASVLNRAEAILRDMRVSGVASTGFSFPYITAKDAAGNSLGIPIEELLGVYSCYGVETANYGNGQINIIQSLRAMLDSTYGKNAWALILKSDSQGSKPLFLTSSLISESGTPEFTEYVSYDFRFPRPCSSGSYERGALLVIAG